MASYYDFISVKRRYTRSVNLERDIKIPDSIDGYIPTSRAIDGLTRFVKAVSQPHSVRAWTLTGAYGTGKSAFAHFLVTLCGEQDELTRKKAIEILRSADNSGDLIGLIEESIPAKGLLRAIVTAQREPIANTITRALYNGSKNYWENALGRKPRALYDISNLNYDVEKGKNVDANYLLSLLKEINRASKSGLLLIIDELGKSLEYAAQNQSLDDLYLLQQIAELPASDEGSNVFMFGLLHQSFADYAHNLGSEQRKEWGKIQGRFEDIPFIESSDRMIQLIGNAIEKSGSSNFQEQISNWAEKWFNDISGYDPIHSLGHDGLFSVYPIHPLTAFALPVLCSKYSQNDRTLFTFLASEEPNSFISFIKSTQVDEEQLQCLKLYHLYDYFVETAGISFSMRPQFQRWVEIHSRIMDANHLDTDLVNILKTIGILNLISTTGLLKASKQTVSLAMCDLPNNEIENDKSLQAIEKLIEKGFLTWRKQIDELRIWEGSDFNIEAQVQNQSQLINIGLAKLLNDYFPLKPLIAQRHSYISGTLRYFERKYYDDLDHFNEFECESSSSDGIIIYWLGDYKEFKKIGGIPQKTSDRRPVLVICASEIKALKAACYEYTALVRISSSTKQLQSDGVARREVMQRVLYTERILEDAVNRSFDITSKKVKCFSLGEKITYKSWSHFQNDLSATLDITYNRGLALWNELINRRDLTSQGAAARHKLITAMIENEGQERLGIVGNGPEYSMFKSMLLSTGIYSNSENGWKFSLPNDDPSISNVWGAIEEFCMTAENQLLSLDKLNDQLSKPPFGVKSGPIPILLLSVLLYYSEHISVYLDGNFIPVLGVEHFELFYRKPERFSVKFFNISGLRAQLFHELGSIFSGSKDNSSVKHRNQTILSVVKPIIGFITQLPQYTIETKDGLSESAIAIRDAVLNAKEPDVLLFDALPKACGLGSLDQDEPIDNKIVKSFRSNLAQALKDLQTAYEKLLTDCKHLIYRGFKISSDIQKIREDLRVRATYLHSQVVEDQLRRFIMAAINEEDSDEVWLETLVMVIADKPARVWKDKDRIVFESKLNDIARRFRNLEALQKEIARDTKTGYIARRVTVTKPDGNDISHVIWIDTEQLKKIEKIADAIIEDNNELMEALVAILVEKTVKSQDGTASVVKETERRIKKIGSK